MTCLTEMGFSCSGDNFDNLFLVWLKKKRKRKLNQVMINGAVFGYFYTWKIDTKK